MSPQVAIPIAIGVVNLLGTAVAVGIAYGMLAEQHRAQGRRLEKLEAMLGNGGAGVFLRIERANELIREGREHRERMATMLGDHESRIRAMESQT